MLLLGACLCAPGRADDVADLISGTVSQAKDDADAAARLIAAGKPFDGAPKIQAAVFQKAYEYGIRKPAGYAHASEALGLLDRITPGNDPWHARRIALYELRYKQRCPRQEKAARGQVLADLLLSTGDKRAETGQWNEASALYRRAGLVAGYCRLGNLDDIRAKQAKAVRYTGLLKRADGLKARLAADARDAKARDELIDLYVIHLDAPAEAAAFVDDSCDETVRICVSLAVRPIGKLQAPACLTLGQWYRQLARTARTREAMTAMLRRARRYLARALALHTARDAMRLKIVAALKEVESAVGKAPVKKDLSQEMRLALTFDKGTWPGRRKSGGRLRDARSKREAATFFGCAVADGLVGEAARLTGGNSFVDTGITHSGGPVTLAFWARRGKSSGGILFGQAGKMQEPNNRLFLALDGPHLTLSLGGTVVKSGTTGECLIDSKWHHYAVLLTGDAVEVYVDGRAVFKRKSPVKLTLRRTHYLGSCNMAGVMQGYDSFGGLLDEAAVFPRRLSVREIKELVKRGKNGTSLVKVSGG